MKRIGWVQVVHDGDDCRAEVHGLAHRLPRTLPVTMATASTLAAEGVPLLVRRSGPAGAR
jgi:hypothetical protein